MFLRLRHATPPYNAGFICELPEVLTPIFDFLIHRTRPGRKLLVCLMMCAVGLALLTLNDQFRPALCDILCLGVPICYSIDLLLTEKAVKHPEVDALGLGVCQLGVVGVITMALSLLMEQPHLPTTPVTWAAALFLGLLCSGVFRDSGVRAVYTARPCGADLHAGAGLWSPLWRILACDTPAGGGRRVNPWQT